MMGGLFLIFSDLKKPERMIPNQVLNYNYLIFRFLLLMSLYGTNCLSKTKQAGTVIRSDARFIQKNN
jgi:hypothetical protein